MVIDLLHLLRNLRRSPASAAAAVLTLALTLGAGASIFAVVDAVLLTPPAFADPDALVVVREVPVDDPAAAPRRVSYSTFEAWRERAGSLAAVEAFEGTNLTLTGVGAAERVRATEVTTGFLGVLGAAPARGRPFDDNDLGQRVVIISHAFWRGKLGADPEVIGRQLVLGGEAHTIVGILPEPFAFSLDACDVWRPLSPAQARSTGYRVSVLARLAGHVSPASLAAVLEDISRQSSPPAHVITSGVVAEIAGSATKTLGLLAASAALATLIAFTNLAGLLIVRSMDRRRELAVRAALGARRYEITRPLVIEAGALVAIGIVVGVILAWWTTPVVGRLALAQFGGLAGREVVVTWRVIAVMAVVAGACAAVCGAVTALLVSGRNLVDDLRRGATAPPHELIVRRVLVTGEVALAFVLIVCVTLLGGSLYRVLSVNPGFSAHGVLVAQVSVPAASYANPEQVASFYAALQSALENRLGSRTVSITNEIPLAGNAGRTAVAVRPDAPSTEVAVREAGAAYFEVMRIPVVAGRAFEARDDAAVAPRVLVSESLARRLFPFETAIGRQIWLPVRAQAAQIVGVVGDVANRALDEPPLPTLYLSPLQSPSRSSIVVARSSLPDAAVIAAVREEVARLDRDLPVYGVRAMSEVIAASPGVAARRVLTAAFIGFALLAVVLGGIGLFGVLAHDVARRRTEFALRIALGADPRRILRSTVSQGAVIVGAGLAVGGVLSFWAARALNSMLFAADRWDVVSVGAAAALLMAAGTCAALPAALRAARTDPVMALRDE